MPIKKHIYTNSKEDEVLIGVPEEPIGDGLHAVKAVYIYDHKFPNTWFNNPYRYRFIGVRVICQLSSEA